MDVKHGKRIKKIKLQFLKKKKIPEKDICWEEARRSLEEEDKGRADGTI